MNSINNNFLSIFSKVKNRPAVDAYSPECFNDFVKHFSSFLEEFRLDLCIEKCIQNADSRAKPILLMSADLSGIQNTVYTISSKGALKTLRARSFMLELLCEHICYELISIVLGNYLENHRHVVFSGGGGLCLILTNSKKCKDKIEKFKKKLNEWSFKEFSGKLYISVVSIELAVDDLKEGHFRNTWNHLSHALDKDKKKKFDYHLDYIFSKKFLDSSEPQQRTNQEECQLCHRDDITLSEEDPFYGVNHPHPIKSPKELTEVSQKDLVFHSLCFQLFRLGSDLVDLQDGSEIYRFSSIPKNRAFIGFPTLNDTMAYYTLKKTDEQPEFVWIVNDISDSQATFLYAYYTRKVIDLPEFACEEESIEAGKDPSHDNATFAELSRTARGADLIGCLRMDVDNLGKIFSEYTKDFSIEELSTLSRLMNLFFKVYINRICFGDLGSDKDGKEISTLDLTEKNYKANRGRNVSIVYAGGDDLFIVGAWDEVAELCYDIQRSFSMYAGLGISGGLTLHRSDYPLYQMAKISGEAEYEAKRFIQKEDGETEPLKNRIALFYSPFYRQKSETLNLETEKNIRKGKHDYLDKLIHVLEWKDTTVVDLVQHFVQMGEVVDNHVELKVPRGLIFKLFRLAEVWWQKKTMYVPEFIYIIERIKRKVEKEKRKNHYAILGAIQRKIFQFPVSNNPDKHRAIRSIRIPMIWVDLLQRKRGE